MPRTKHLDTCMSATDITQCAMIYPEEEEKKPDSQHRVRSNVNSLDRGQPYPPKPLDLSEVDLDASESPHPTFNQPRLLASEGFTHHLRVPSYQAANFPDLAGEVSTRPRGTRGSADAQEGTYSTFTTRAHRTRTYRSWCSRVLYTVVLLNTVIWVPLWLKLLVISRNETQGDELISIYNSSIDIHLSVSTFDDPLTECGLCDAADDGEFGVTYPITATVNNFHDRDGIPAASYLSLIASYDFENWFTVNKPGLLTGLPTGNSVVDVCRSDAIPLDDDEKREDDDDNSVNVAGASGSVKSTTFKISNRETETSFGNNDDDGSSIDLVEVTEIVTEFTTFSPTTVEQKATEAPTPLDIDDSYISRCCLDKPGFIYIVACVSPYEYLQRAEFYTKVEMPPFDDQCIAIASRCGVACNVDADAPIENTCEQGEIPLEHLVRRKFLPKDDDDGDSEPSRRRLNGNDRRHYDRRFQFTSWRPYLYHSSFVFFVTLMAMGTWISFFAGIGSIQDPLKPSMSEVEAYMAAKNGGDDKQKKPLCLVAFSISASEPRMMVLRNLCGKMMSWIYQRKFTLSARPTDECCDHSIENRSVMQRIQTQRQIEAAQMTEYVEFIDIFTDEGHRVGAYALWDAFVDLVHDADLRFVENMANKMTTMTADDDRLLSKTEDDAFCLDDELRSMASSNQNEMGITQEQIDQLEMAFATYDLLTALGHHAFWRSDNDIDPPGFRDLATDPKACSALRRWAGNYREEKKRTGNPFAPNCAPTTHPGIDQKTWNSWWELYDEVGRNQWVKRFDCTKFRRVRLHYDCGQNGEDHCRDLMMCYTARANPEDLKIQLGPTVNRRGIGKGVFVRLKEAGHSVHDETAKLFKKHGMTPLSRAEARRCHARVVTSKTMVKVGKRYVPHATVKECTPDLLRVLPSKFLVNDGRVGDDDLEDQQTVSLLASFRRRALRDEELEGEEAVIPVELLQPLRESRGKSGGMNHAMESAFLRARILVLTLFHASAVLNFYLRHYSSTMHVMKRNHARKRTVKPRRVDSKHCTDNLEIPENSKKNETAACMLFAIFDCRHMATQGFWDVVIPYFYKYRYLNNPWSRELAIDRPVAFVQLPQTFNSLTIDTDIFDMREDAESIQLFSVPLAYYSVRECSRPNKLGNEYLFRIANNIRTGVGAITSCGTNAVWNYDIKYQQDPLEHRFNEDTMIEDTASSHDVIIAGRKGVYHFERLVLGSRKGTNDYLAAVFRWSRGAVQLFWTTFWFPRYKYVWPWAVLVLHICPIAAVTAKLDNCHQTYLTKRIGWVPCRSGPFFGLVGDPVFVIFLVTMITLASGTFVFHRLGAFTVMFENVTYFFTSMSAFYWVSIPLYMCFAKNGLPVIFDVQVLTTGALWLQLHMAMILAIVKKWSPLENGNAPSDQSLLRSQQMYVVTAPLHLLAIIWGMKDGFEICFRRKDASRWSSFDSIMAMTAVKLWVISLFGILVAAIVVGAYNAAVYDDSREEKGVRALGIFFCVMLLFLVWTPFRGMFFYHSVIKKISKPSHFDRFVAAIFGKKKAVRPDYIYICLWIIVLVFSPRFTDGIFNGRSRCSINPNDGGCEDVELYRFTRVRGDGLAQ